MSGASLHQVQLNGANLASDLLLDQTLQNLGSSGKSRMAEYIHSSALALAQVGTIRILDALTDCNNDSIFGFQTALNICDEAVGIKGTLAKINQLRAAAVVFTGKCCCCGQPACISAHDFDNGDCRNVINLAVTHDFGKGCRNIFSCGTKARTMVGHWQVVVDSLWCAHNIQVFDAMLADVSRQLVHGIHRVVSADIDKIPDFSCNQGVHDFFQLCFIRVV